MNRILVLLALLVLSNPFSFINEVQAASDALPSVIQKAMKKAHVAPSDISIVVEPVEGKGTTLRYNGSIPRTPASVEKIVTSAAALDILGPSKMWMTSIYSDAKVDEKGVLKGNLYLVGRGDPSFNVEKFWMLLDNLRARGIKKIIGDLVVDRSFYSVPKHDPFAFDGDGNRPYNLGPDALLVNFRSLVIQIRPNKEKGVAYLYEFPELKTIKLPKTIPLSKQPCLSWRKQIKPDFSNPDAPIFRGAFPLRCGNRDLLYTAYSANDYLRTLFSDMWTQVGGTWRGKVVEGKFPKDNKDMEILASAYSDPLARILYNMNKWSNNLTARQLFLNLGETEKDEPKNLEASRKSLAKWASSLGIKPQELFVENGSGLSRESKLSANAAATILKSVWKSPHMSEFISSLPISGVDGTMKKRHVAQGFAHIKTGYISKARSIAGYVLAKDGKRYVVVAFINGPSAIGSMPVLDSVINWVYSQ